MSRIAAVGTGPVEFFTTLGTQVEIPISAIYFDDVTRAVGTTRPSDADSTTILAYLGFLASRGVLAPGIAPPPPVALVATASVNAPGAEGNRITLQVTPAAAAPSDPLQVDVIATEIDQYDHLTIANLADVLGTGLPTITAGTQPGLLRAQPVPAGAAAPTVGGTIAASGGTWTISGAGPTAVILEPRVSGAAFDAGSTIVAVTAADAHGVFALTVTWKRTAPGVTAAAMPAALDPLSYLVTFAPPSPAPFALPGTGTVRLAGGADATTEVKAKASVFAKT